MVDCNNMNINILSSIFLLMENIWNLLQSFNYLAKKGLVVEILVFDGQISIKTLQILAFMIIVGFFPIMFIRFLFGNLLSSKKKKKFFI